MGTAGTLWSWNLGKALSMVLLGVGSVAENIVVKCTAEEEGAVAEAGGMTGSSVQLTSSSSSSSDGTAAETGPALLWLRAWRRMASVAAAADDDGRADTGEKSQSSHFGSPVLPVWICLNLKTMAKDTTPMNATGMKALKKKLSASKQVQKNK